MKNKIYFLGLLLALCFIQLGFNYRKGDPIAKLILKLNKWRNNYPQEKVHLHLDKSIYTIDEEIWLKAYIVNSEKNQLSALSSTLHIELINDTDSIKQTIKLPINYGLAANSLTLPKSSKTGNYRIRAYTNYMRNLDSHYCFEKTLTIINPTDISSKTKLVLAHQTTASDQKEKRVKDIDFQFFPEGGYLINGLSGKLAFKANDKNGNGVPIKGVIKDQENKVIAQLESVHQGMGQLLFTPIKGQTYKAWITLPNGTTLTQALPNALEQGFMMSLNELTPDTIALNISCSKWTENTVAEEIYILAQQSGKVYYAAKTLVNDTNFVTHIAKNLFPTGIVQFTLFSANGLPLSERMVFVQNPNHFLLSTTAIKQTYQPREKVAVLLAAADQQNKPVNGNFSVAVIEEKRGLNEDEETSILSNLLLTSDLKGYIEKPNSYFRANNTQTRAQLDLLMLTHGYRRFEWKKVLNDETPNLSLLPEKGLQISGYLKTTNNKPLNNSRVSLFAKGKTLLFLDTLTDRTGKFKFENLSFEDSTAFIVQALDGKNKNKAKIELIPENIPPIIKGHLMKSLAVDSSMLTTLQSRIVTNEEAIWLKEIELKTTRKILKYSDNINGPGKADQVFTAEDFKLSACMDLSQCLQGKLTGVIFQNGAPYSTRMLKDPMRIVLDGLLKDADFKLSEIPIQQVESVEVLKSMAFTSAYGADGGTGLIIVTSKRGEMSPETIIYHQAPDVISFYLKGYEVSRTFYSPQYEQPKQANDPIDLRSTLFWAPQIFTTNGKAEFSFFNSDQKGKFKVIIEGIADDGSLARHTYSYEVR